VDVRVDAPATGRVGTRLSYRVTVTGAGRAGADAARVCTRVPASFTATRAPGTFRYQGMRCLDVRGLGRGQRRSFLVYAVPAGHGTIRVPALAAALTVDQAGAAA
jgi:hypothetical protein